jgi:hypothetical protein
MPLMESSEELAVTLELNPPIRVVCPPHHWLIERLGLHSQQWTCQRCGAEQAHDITHKNYGGWGQSSGRPKAK